MGSDFFGPVACRFFAHHRCGDPKKGAKVLLRDAPSSLFFGGCSWVDEDVDGGVDGGIGVFQDSGNHPCPADAGAEGGVVGALLRARLHFVVVLLVFKRDGDEFGEVFESWVTLREFVLSSVIEADVANEKLFCLSSHRYVEVFAAAHGEEEGADGEIGHRLTQFVVVSLFLCVSREVAEVIRGDGLLSLFGRVGVFPG